MRKTAIVIAALLVLAPTAHAGVAALATLADFDDLGLGARWNLLFPIEGSSLALGGTYFLDGEYLAVDGDLHLSLRNSRIYPLAGLQVATDFDNSDLNLNLGAGIGFGAGKLGAFLEGKFVIGDRDYFAATFGLQF